MSKDYQSSNILFADFLGWQHGIKFKTPFDNAGLCNGELTHICYGNELKFDSDWNWFMLVVQKINENISGGIVYDLRQELINVNLENAYNEAVKIVQWYNNRELMNETLKEENIQVSKKGFYCYVNHAKKIATTGFATKGTLKKWTTNIRFSNDTIEIMKQRYEELF